MTKKTRKKNVQTAALASGNSDGKTTPAPDQTGVNDEREKPFDFGGLPARDLKKNMGCG